MCDHTSRGPVSTLPGSIHPLPESTSCTKHPALIAVARVQGETDSFGCEYVDMCAVCLTEHREYRKIQYETPRYCQWCRCIKTRVRKHRDFEEGSSGPVYDVCADCRQAELDQLEDD